MKLTSVSGLLRLEHEGIGEVIAFQGRTLLYLTKKGRSVIEGVRPIWDVIGECRFWPSVSLTQIVIGKNSPKNKRRKNTYVLASLLVAGGRKAPELHPPCFGLVTANYIYAPAKYGSREMRRIDPALGRTSCQISPP